MKPAQNPRLLLAASLLCTFSLVGVVGYHATPSAAHASRNLTPPTPAEVAARRAEARRFQAESGQTAGGASARPTSRAVETPGYTLAEDGSGLVPTVLPGLFLDAEAGLEDAAADAPGAAPAAGVAADATQDAEGFSPRSPRRPGSLGSPNAGR